MSHSFGQIFVEPLEQKGDRYLARKASSPVFQNGSPRKKMAFGPGRLRGCGWTNSASRTTVQIFSGRMRIPLSIPTNNACNHGFKVVRTDFFFKLEGRRFQYFQSGENGFRPSTVSTPWPSNSPPPVQSASSTAPIRSCSASLVEISGFGFSFQVEREKWPG